MGLPRQHFGQYGQWLKKTLLGLSLIVCIEPAKAFTPYIYTPNPKELEKTGVNIGKTAAQLLYLGQNQQIMILIRREPKLHHILNNIVLDIMQLKIEVLYLLMIVTLVVKLHLKLQVATPVLVKLCLVYILVIVMNFILKL